MGVTLLTSDFILLRNIVGHDLNDIFNIQMRGLNFNSLAAADGRMEARSGVLVAMVATAPLLRLAIVCRYLLPITDLTFVTRAEHPTYPHPPRLHTSHHVDSTTIATNVLNSHLNLLFENGKNFNNNLIAE